MIYVNPRKIAVSQDWIDNSKDLTKKLKRTAKTKRASFVKKHRKFTWGSPELLLALRAAIGNKCWYSEVPLEGSDPNVDHFHPKGAIREVDCENNFSIGSTSKFSYWWWAFELNNFRLSSMHSNQRRVDENTSGGKWDFFPVKGDRAQERCNYLNNQEIRLAIDPCSKSDVSLIGFDPDGKVICSRSHPSDFEILRVKTSVWLYHLDKYEIEQLRAKYMMEIRADLEIANADYDIWQTDPDNALFKNRFDVKLSEIQMKIEDSSPFAGAKRSVVRISIANYAWIDTYLSNF